MLFFTHKEDNMQNRSKHSTEFEKMYAAHYSKLKRFAREYVIREADAENIVHDVFLELWEQKSSLESHTNLSAFLFRSTKNRCIDFLRHKIIATKTVDKIQKEYRHTLQLKFQSLEAFDDKLFSENDVEKMIRDAIESLPKKCRQIFVLNKIEGKKQKEIAAELHISINTVESQMAIAYKKLKEVLKDAIPLFIFFF